MVGSCAIIIARTCGPEASHPSIFFGGDTLLEANCLIEVKFLLKVKPLIEAKSMECAGLPGAQGSRGPRVRVPKGAGSRSPKEKLNNYLVEL